MNEGDDNAAAAILKGECRRESMGDEQEMISTPAFDFLSLHIETARKPKLMTIRGEKHQLFMEENPANGIPAKIWIYTNGRLLVVGIWTSPFPPQRDRSRTFVLFLSRAVP